MNFADAARLTERLLAFALFLQAFEIFFVTRSKVFHRIWSYENIRADLEAGLPLPNSLVALVFGARGFQATAALQTLLALIALIWPSGGLFVALAVGHILICLRFRGSFNGGSDMMTNVCLAGVLVLTLGANENIQRLGLLYVAVQLIYSYFKAGAVKLKYADWRAGRALPAFLSRSPFTDIKRIGVMLRFKPGVARTLTFAILIFEMSALVLPFASRAVNAYFALALVFHFTIYRAFGLNRFFWIWLTAWPSLFYLSSLI